MKSKDPESLYLGQGFKKRSFPDTRKEVEIKFRETPLFKARHQEEEEVNQLNLFDGKEG